jgi:DNA-binding transcriptional LysR family regulator
MAINTPDWHLYRSFLEVMREGSLSGAARALGMTQPTIGRQVAALEAALEINLFTRSLEGLAPTEAALRLLPAAEAMAAAAETAQRAASGGFDEERGTVRITASEVIGAEVLPSILARFRELHPALTLELVLTNRNEDLLRGDADIAVRMMRPTQDALIAKRIGKIDVALYAHRRYLKAHGLPGLRDDLAGHALIGFDRDPAFARLLDFLGAQLSRNAFSFRSDSHLAQLAALRAGFGIGISQLGIARRDKNLIPVLHSDLMFPMDMWLAMHRDLRTSRRVRLVFDYLATELASYAQSSGRHG